MENADATVVNQNTVSPQPNDSVNQSNVSICPEDRLPEETKGQIQEICKNPEVEQKRRVNHQEAMRMNTYSLKNGKFSKNFHSFSCSRYSGFKLLKKFVIICDTRHLN